jgi:hypothetical protein
LLCSSPADKSPGRPAPSLVLPSTTISVRMNPHLWSTGRCLSWMTRLSVSVAVKSSTR